MLGRELSHSSLPEAHSDSYGRSGVTQKKSQRTPEPNIDIFFPGTLKSSLLVWNPASAAQLLPGRSSSSSEGASRIPVRDLWTRQLPLLLQSPNPTGLACHVIPSSLGTELPGTLSTWTLHLVLIASALTPALLATGVTVGDWAKWLLP